MKDIVSMIGILENEYKDLLDTYKRYENNEISEEEYNQIISSISNVIIEKTRLGDNEVQEIQNDFSKKFDYEVLPIE